MTIYGSLLLFLTRILPSDYFKVVSFYFKLFYKFKFSILQNKSEA